MAEPLPSVRFFLRQVEARRRPAVRLEAAAREAAEVSIFRVKAVQMGTIMVNGLDSVVTPLAQMAGKELSPVMVRLGRVAAVASCPIKEISCGPVARPMVA